MVLKAFGDYAKFVWQHLEELEKTTSICTLKNVYLDSTIEIKTFTKWYWKVLEIKRLSWIEPNNIIFVFLIT